MFSLKYHQCKATSLRFQVFKTLHLSLFSIYLFISISECLPKTDKTFKTAELNVHNLTFLQLFNTSEFDMMTFSLRIHSCQP